MVGERGDREIRPLFCILFRTSRRPRRAPWQFAAPRGALPQASLSRSPRASPALPQPAELHVFARNNSVARTKGYSSSHLWHKRSAASDSYMCGSGPFPPRLIAICGFALQRTDTDSSASHRCSCLWCSSYLGLSRTSIVPGCPNQCFRCSEHPLQRSSCEISHLHLRKQ